MPREYVHVEPYVLYTVGFAETDPQSPEPAGETDPRLVEIPPDLRQRYREHFTAFMAVNEELGALHANGVPVGARRSA